MRQIPRENCNCHLSGGRNIREVALRLVEIAPAHAGATQRGSREGEDGRKGQLGDIKEAGGEIGGGIKEG